MWLISQLFHYILEAIIKAFNVVVFTFQYSTDDLENKVTMILFHLCCIRKSLLFRVFHLNHLWSCSFFDQLVELKRGGNETKKKKIKHSFARTLFLIVDFEIVFECKRKIEKFAFKNEFNNFQICKQT